jgi:hypothetical protein
LAESKKTVVFIRIRSIFSTNIYPASKDILTNGAAICFRGAEKDERIGVDIKCPPLGEGPLGIFNIRREARDVLRFTWREQTWTAAEKRCKLVEDWHTSPFSKVCHLCDLREG